jgi:hypothetical protein
MATETISIDVDAYERLKSVQKPTESFSQTIKRVVRKPVDLKAWFAAMDRAPLRRRAANAHRPAREGAIATTALVSSHLGDDQASSRGAGET